MKTLNKVLYTAVSTANAGREGRVRSDDGAVDLALSMPKSLGGPGTPGTTNPEQLFASGYAACFGSALRLVGGKQRVDVSRSEITAAVSIGDDGGGFGLSVELRAKLPGVPTEQAHALLAAAHEVCPYSKATRGNIPVTLTLAE